MINQLVNYCLSCCAYANYDNNNRSVRWRIWTPCRITALALSKICAGGGIYMIIKGSQTDDGFLPAGIILTIPAVVVSSRIVILSMRACLKARRLERERREAESNINQLTQLAQQAPFTPISVLIDPNQSLVELVPPEILINIFNHLSMEELNRAAVVCKKWYQLTSDPLIWKKFAQIKGIPDNDEKYQGRVGYITFLSKKGIAKANEGIISTVIRANNEIISTAWKTDSYLFKE